MLIQLVLAAALGQTGKDSLVCKYDPDRNGSQVVLRGDGSIRFVSDDVAEKDSVMRADVFHRTSSRVIYRLVMPGRTDTFEVSLKTLRGTQRLSAEGSNEERVFHLSCER
jgi:hypothetical protein